jgi:hypothetical protein
MTTLPGREGDTVGVKASLAKGRSDQGRGASRASSPGERAHDAEVPPAGIRRPGRTEQHAEEHQEARSPTDQCRSQPPSGITSPIAMRGTSSHRGGGTKTATANARTARRDQCGRIEPRHDRIANRRAGWYKCG